MVFIIAFLNVITTSEFVLVLTHMVFIIAFFKCNHNKVSVFNRIDPSVYYSDLSVIKLLNNMTYEREK